MADKRLSEIVTLLEELNLNVLTLLAKDNPCFHSKAILAALERVRKK